LAVVVAVAVAPGSENGRGGEEGEGEACVYVAESAGIARRVALDVCPLLRRRGGEEGRRRR